MAKAHQDQKNSAQTVSEANALAAGKITESEFLLYKAVLKLSWIYVFQLWGTASKSNMEILQRF
jgi:hypothetical protein